MGSQFPLFYWTKITSSDIILTVEQNVMDLIVEQKRNHLFLKYQLPEGITRIWLYETGGQMAITYLMFTETPKVPGEILDLGGQGNIIFNRKTTEYVSAYPILILYEVLPPLREDKIKMWYGWNGQGPREPKQHLIGKTIGMKRVF